jgi:hypothetical protein
VKKKPRGVTPRPETAKEVRTETLEGRTKQDSINDVKEIAQFLRVLTNTIMPPASRQNWSHAAKSLMEGGSIRAKPSVDINAYL